MIELRFGRNESRRLTGTRYRATIKTCLLRALSLAAARNPPPSFSARDRVESETKLNTEGRKNRVRPSRKGKLEEKGRDAVSPSFPRCRRFLPRSRPRSRLVTIPLHTYTHTRTHTLSSRLSVFLVAIREIIARSSFEFYFFHQYLKKYVHCLYIVKKRWSGRKVWNFNLAFRFQSISPVFTRYSFPANNDASISTRARITLLESIFIPAVHPS